MKKVKFNNLALISQTLVIALVFTLVILAAISLALEYLGDTLISTIIAAIVLFMLYIFPFIVVEQGIVGVVLAIIAFKRKETLLKSVLAIVVSLFVFAFGIVAGVWMYPRLSEGFASV